MVMGDNSPRVTVDRVLADAAGERLRGCNTTDVGALKEALEDAYGRLSAFENVKKCSTTAEQRKKGIACDFTPMCIDCALAEALMARDCGLTREDREAKKACPVWGHEELDNCAACELFNAKLERDCQATEEQRSAGICLASHLGIDRCSECTEHRHEKRHEDECAGRAAEIARLTRECDEARSAAKFGASVDIAALRHELVVAKGRHDCGITAECRRSGPCPRLAAHGAACEECFVSAMTANVTRSEEAKRETLLRQIEGLNNALQIVTAERNAAIVKADSRPLPAVKARAPKRDMGGDLFSLIPAAAEPVAPVAAEVKPKRKGRKGKEYPLTPAKGTP